MWTMTQTTIMNRSHRALPSSKQCSNLQSIAMAFMLLHIVMYGMTFKLFETTSLPENNPGVILEASHGVGTQSGVRRPSEEASPSKPISIQVQGKIGDHELKINANSNIGLLNFSTAYALPTPESPEGLTSPVGDLIKIYFYDNLPAYLGADIENYWMNYYVNQSKQSAAASEQALIQLFRSYPGRTRNPDEANVFVVPYPHAGDCHSTPGWQLGCKHVASEDIQDLERHLTYFPGNEDRHLFIAAKGPFLTNAAIARHRLLLTAGPVLPGEKSGKIVITQFNAGLSYQPSAILARGKDWWTRPRKYLFSYYFGENNKRMNRGPRRFRKYFRQDMDGQPDTLGGMPYVMKSMATGDYDSLRRQMYDDYANSIFCPVLSGDTSWQPRFFDVILSGCIPVVLSWTDSGNQTSWFLPRKFGKASTVQESYPFAPGVFDETVEVDYDSFVVQCPGNEAAESDVSVIRKTMEGLLQTPDAIRSKQSHMRDASLYFTFGLGEDAHQHEDQFARIIRALKHYTDHL